VGVWAQVHVYECACERKRPYARVTERKVRGSPAVGWATAAPLAGTAAHALPS
jgi:hypothetical protein